MTLDDLIEALQELRAKHPAAGLAHVNGDVDLDSIRYEFGEVHLVEFDEDDEFDIVEVGV